ncbi:hypothetical protein H5410_015147 [Solanum commersonii]|uniref:Uncharacterized protein n=1 Tax=Solanum commersonii TaxID=4109 RepID=A0A9J5ZT95_SOLCO|nr:hypothetical protein H5410_015147 [Solanum commersonii]
MSLFLLRLADEISSGVGSYPRPKIKKKELASFAQSAKDELRDVEESVKEILVPAPFTSR